jgi:hypothetical protein
MRVTHYSYVLIKAFTRLGARFEKSLWGAARLPAGLKKGYSWTYQRGYVGIIIGS